MLERCRQGPPAARVDRLDITEQDEPPPDGFAVKPTV
jgi:hypothetical protein